MCMPVSLCVSNVQFSQIENTDRKFKFQQPSEKDKLSQRKRVQLWEVYVDLGARLQQIRRIKNLSNIKKLKQSSTQKIS